MTFPNALAAVFNDNRFIQRRIWNNARIYLRLDEHQRLCTTWNSEQGSVDGFLHPLILTEQDYFSDDWEIIDG